MLYDNPQGKDPMDTIRLTAPEVEKHDTVRHVGIPWGPRMKIHSRFVYVCYPHSWGWDRVHGFLPSVKKIVAVPGLNGIPANGSFAGTLASLALKGATYIDPKDSRLGPFQNYARSYKVVDQENRVVGRHWVDWCQEASVLPNGEVLWNRDDVHDKFCEFRAKIRDSGIVSPLVREVYLRVRGKLEQRLKTMSERSGTNPRATPQIKQMEKDLAQMEKDWAKLCKALTPTTLKPEEEA